MTEIASPPTSRTPTAPARRPDGWWWAHPRYRSYVLFAATGFVLVIAALMLLRAVTVLGEGAAAWNAFLDGLGGPTLVLNALFWVGIVFFAVRFLRVGTKVNAVPIGPLPALPEPVWLAVSVGGLVAASALILLIMWGVIL